VSPAATTASTTSAAPSETAAPTSAAAPAPAATAELTTTAAATAPMTSASTGEEPPRILVRAKSNSWIQIRDESAGELLVTRLLRSGDSYEVPNRTGLRLATGNAGALEIVVDGTVVPAIGDDGAVRRNVLLDVEKLKAGQAVAE
jgi:cytoskeleton protein RodZ